MDQVAQSHKPKRHIMNSFFEPAIYLNPLRHFFVKQFFINVHREAIILGQPPPPPPIGTIFLEI